MIRARQVLTATVLGVLALSLSACQAGSGSADGTAPSAAAADGVNLADVCPATVVIQTDWNPEAEHGHLYQLVGDDPQIDAGQKTVTGDLVSAGKPTGVKVEIRSGGPAIGYQSVSATMYTDKAVMLGYVTTDEGIRNAQKLPTKAVFAALEKSPQMIMWDPATYPQATDLKSLGPALQASGGVIRYFNGASYMDYLTGSGVLPTDVLDGGYEGTPAAFVAAKGKDAQQAFATSEPYTYKNEISAWGKDVRFQLIADTGYPVYPEAMVVRSADEEQYRACLTKLVPVLQQAGVDYLANPAETNDLIVDLVTEYNNGWVYSVGVANFAVEQMKALGIAANGPSGYAGEMSEARVQRVLDITTPLFTKQGNPPKAGLSPSDLATNEYLDPTITF